MWMRAAGIALLVLSTAACAPAIDATIHDATITAAVKTALLNADEVDGTLVTVRTDGATVYLGGEQPSPEAAAHVVTIVRGVDGVRDVQSEIVSRGSEIAADTHAESDVAR
jgi:hyperosmotically inducible protein